MSRTAKKLIKGIKILRVSELESKEIKEIWVLNNTNPKGEIALSVKNRADGAPSLVTIPPTWVPVCLTEQVPKGMLIESPEFRRLAASQGVLLLEPKGVQTIMDHPDITREVQEIKRRATGEAVEEVPAELAREQTQSVLILDILSRETNNEIQEQEALDILNSQEDSLTNADLEHLVKNSSFQKVKKWASEAIQDREEGDD